MITVHTIKATVLLLKRFMIDYLGVIA